MTDCASDWRCRQTRAPSTAPPGRVPDDIDHARLRIPALAQRQPAARTQPRPRDAPPRSPADPTPRMVQSPAAAVDCCADCHLPAHPRRFMIGSSRLSRAPPEPGAVAPNLDLFLAMPRPRSEAPDRRRPRLHRRPRRRPASRTSWRPQRQRRCLQLLQPDRDRVHARPQPAS